MITEEHIKTQLDKHRHELTLLQSRHENMVREYQQRSESFNAQVQHNQIRFQQLSGAIGELEALLEPQNDNTDNGSNDSSRPGVPVDGIPDSVDRVGDRREPDLVH
jgi:hypothetical protein